jgi:hypothetical protein
MLMGLTFDRKYFIEAHEELQDELRTIQAGVEIWRAGYTI